MSARPRTRRVRRAAARVTIAAAIALVTGLAIKAPENKTAAAAETQPEFYTVTVTQNPAFQELTMLNYKTEAKVEEKTQLEPKIQINQIPLDGATQDTIWDTCRESPALFCTVMAIANRETRFDSAAIGDDGNSFGLLQIQPRWHQERMDRLGVTDLTDPVQSAKVAVDYIDWIAERLCPGCPEDAYGTHALFMAYNQGWSGAQGYWSDGIYSTGYSLECSGYFDDYMTKLEVAE